MRMAFADTFYYLAVVNERDPWHELAADYGQDDDIRIVTTGWVLTEVGDALSETAHNRAMFGRLYASLRANPDVLIVPFSDELFDAGLDLYARRPDKEWSLTDCVSFVVMERNGLTEALTGDHHFAQAGFVPLLRP